MYKTIGKIGAFLYCAALAVLSVVVIIRDANRNLISDVVIEAGSRIQIEDFFKTCPNDARFISDVSTIDTNEPAVYQLKVIYDEVFEKDVVLRIEDHTAPRGVALPQALYTTWNAPEAADCVGYLYDLSGIAKVEYKEKPVFKEGGDFNVPVLVTDVYGNTATIDVPFTVIDDHKGPIIRGVHDLETVTNNEPDYFDGVTAKDDYDEDPVIRIDDSKVDYENPGTYEVKYIAIDKANNFTTRTVMLKITKGTGNADAASDSEYDVSGSESGGGGGGGGGGSSRLSDAKRLASRVLSGLWRSNDVETARAIFNWVHNHVYYANCGSLSYAQAAYRGFSRRSGDCYVYYSCCKMLLDLAGIPNMMVKRYPVTGSNHYWNLVKLNGQWYHCDSTRFRHRGSIYFMCTDEQINDKYHRFNGKLYPARAGGSTDFLPSDTPTPTETPTPEVTETPTPTPEATITDGPTPTGSANPTVTGADTPTPTPETSQGATVTPTPGVTDQPAPTDSPTPPPTNTPTDVPPPPPPPPTEETTKQPTADDGDQ